MLRVCDLMVPTVRSIHRDDFVTKVEGILNTEHISCAPLVDNDGELVGLITQADLNDLERNGGNPYLTKAWEIACSEVVTLPVSASLSDAAQTILDTQVRNLIVTDGGTPVGMLSVSDLVDFVDHQIRSMLYTGAV